MITISLTTFGANTIHDHVHILDLVAIWNGNAWHLLVIQALNLSASVAFKMDVVVVVAVWRTRGVA